jgi:predicted transposase YdaD
LTNSGNSGSLLPLIVRQFKSKAQHHTYELRETEDLPWSLGLMALTILSSDEMLEKARGMLQGSKTSNEGSAILDLVITAIIYKFAELTRDEVLTMLGLELKEPRAFQESKAEGIEQERKAAIEALIIARFGTIDEELAAVVPKLMGLESGEYAGLLLRLSRLELLALP